MTLAAAFAAEDAPSQTFRYLAFGDSNTCGHQDGSTCGHPPVTVDPLDPNGYPGRLRGSLNCQNGNNCQVYNYGKSGEKTAPALSRLDNVLNAQDFDVMLLMHGTNDIVFDESYASLIANLKAMDDKVAAKGVDTLFASLIRLHPSGPYYSSGRVNKVADLKDELLDTVAPSRDSWTANPWLVLCPGNNCFDQHYAWPDDNGLHPDPSGYNLMANEFLAAIQQHPVPTTPTAQAPNGPTSTTTVTWPALDHTTWYQLDWGAEDKWLASTAVCGSGSCSWTIPGLGAGDHAWKVRGRNPRGRGSWSALTNFHLYTAAPTAAQTLSPSGDFYGSSPGDFAWSDEDSALNGVTAYQLRIERDGVTVFDQDVATATCNGSECSHDPSIGWSSGLHRWQVRSKNPAGNSPWSSWRQFLFMGTAPAVPQALDPSTDTFDRTPLLTWTHEFGATEFLVKIDGGLETTVNAAAVCATTTCSWSPAGNLTIGNHSWRVKARNPVGDSSYSSDRAFEVLACSPSDLDLSNTTVTNATTKASCRTVSAHTNYVVAAPGGNLELHAGDSIHLGEGFVVESGAVLRCRVDP